MAGAGSNSIGPGAKKLRSFLTRLDALDQEIDGLKEDRKEVVAEAEAAGLSKKHIEFVLKTQKMDREQLREDQTTRYNYLFAVDPELAEIFM